MSLAKLQEALDEGCMEQAAQMVGHARRNGYRVNNHHVFEREGFMPSRQVELVPHHNHGKQIFELVADLSSHQL